MFTPFKREPNGNSQLHYCNDKRGELDFSSDLSYRQVHAQTECDLSYQQTTTAILKLNSKGEQEIRQSELIRNRGE